MLEIAEVIEVETDENSHNLRTAHSPFTLSMLDAVRLLQSQFWVSRKTQLQPLSPHAHNFIT